MAINIKADLGKIGQAAKTINTVGIVVSKSTNVSTALKVAHTVVTNEFVMHMARTSVTNPEALGHMYEWGRIGDPNARLWKHVLRGAGKNRQSRFEFKASKSVVPVDPKLAEVGVEKRHIFYWKAPILEYGLQVRIEPKVAKALVYLNKETRNPSITKFSGFVKNGIVYRKSPVTIQRAGNKLMWGAFTKEYTEWFNSSEPSKVLETKLKRALRNAITNTTRAELAKINKQKDAVQNKLSIQPLGYDATVGQKLQNALDNNYAVASKNRVVE